MSPRSRSRLRPLRPIVAFGEALRLAKSLGLRRGDTLDVLAESPIGPTVAAKRANVEADRYRPSFELRHAVKDMRLIDEVAHAAGSSSWKRTRVARASRAP
jgi:3-hydroxyisobutyrate dehydrogenase-like beta-hydroxyacid dehydrogenase